MVIMVSNHAFYQLNSGADWVGNAEKDSLEEFVLDQDFQQELVLLVDADDRVITYFRM